MVFVAPWMLWTRSRIGLRHGVRNAKCLSNHTRFRFGVSDELGQSFGRTGKDAKLLLCMCDSCRFRHLTDGMLCRCPEMMVSNGLCYVVRLGGMVYPVLVLRLCDGICFCFLLYAYFRFDNRNIVCHRMSFAGKFRVTTSLGNLAYFGERFGDGAHNWNVLDDWNTFGFGDKLFLFDNHRDVLYLGVDLNLLLDARLDDCLREIVGNRLCRARVFMTRYWNFSNNGFGFNRCDSTFDREWLRHWHVNLLGDDLTFRLFNDTRLNDSVSNVFSNGIAVPSETRHNLPHSLHFSDCTGRNPFHDCNWDVNLFRLDTGFGYPFNESFGYSFCPVPPKPWIIRSLQASHSLHLSVGANYWRRFRNRYCMCNDTRIGNRFRNILGECGSGRFGGTWMFMTRHRPWDVLSFRFCSCANRRNGEDLEIDDSLCDFYGVSDSCRASVSAPYGGGNEFLFGLRHNVRATLLVPSVACGDGGSRCMNLRFRLDVVLYLGRSLGRS